jgi:GNAT superfamily N-acetyltransferase
LIPLIGESHIHPATLDDVPATKALLDVVSRWLISRGIRQWNYGFMPIETLRGRAERGELYVCVRDGEVIGTLTMQEADQALWGTDQGECLYLHTLAVRPDLRGTGLGRWMLEWVEASARERGKARVRLDCLAHSEPLRRYYRGAGYDERGVKQMNATWIAVLFEKEL